MKPSILLKIILVLIFTAITITINEKHESSTFAQQPSNLPQVEDLNTSSKELIDQVWQIVDKSYIDPTFNGHDWKAVRNEYLNRNYNSFEDAYQAIKEMLKLLGDPFTRFMNPEEFRKAQIQTSGEDSFGVGLRLIQDQKTQELIISAPVEVTPAYQAGILPGDVLIKIDGENVQGLFMYEVNTRLEVSVEGQIFVLSVRRGQQELEFEVPTTKLKSTAVRYRRQDTNSSAISIGYIRLNTLNSESFQTREAINELEKQNVSGYILDLRSNPGGFLYASVAIAQMWMDKGDIFYMLDRQGERDRQQANNSALTDKPLVVIIDGGTSSGSEILSGALQDNNRAILVGTQTSGNNSIQSVREVGNRSGLAVTIAKWYTPNGKDIDQSGIIPDVVVDITPEQYKTLIQERTIETLDDPQYAQAVEQLLQLIAK